MEVQCSRRILLSFGYVREYCNAQHMTFPPDQIVILFAEWLLHEDSFSLPKHPPYHMDFAQIKASKRKYIDLFLATAWPISCIGSNLECDIEHAKTNPSINQIFVEQGHIHTQATLVNDAKFLVTLYKKFANGSFSQFIREGYSICYVGINEDQESLNWIFNDYTSFRLSQGDDWDSNKPIFAIIIKTKSGSSCDGWNSLLKEKTSVKFHHQFMMDLTVKDYQHWKTQIQSFAVYMAHYQAIVEAKWLQARRLAADERYCVVL